MGGHITLQKTGCMMSFGMTRPQGYKPLSCSTQLSMKFQLLIKAKMLKNKDFSFKLSDVAFIMLINVKMPTIVGILTLMSMINFMLILVEDEKFFITSGPVYQIASNMSTNVHNQVCDLR